MGTKSGVTIHSNGDVHIAHASTPGIYFHYAAASANTAYITEQSSGALKIGSYLTINADSRINYLNGATGTFALWVNGSIGTNNAVWGTNLRAAANSQSTTAFYYGLYMSNNNYAYGQLRNYYGTASTKGWADLVLGNGTAQGTAGNANGRIVFYTQTNQSANMYGYTGALGSTTRNYCWTSYLSATQVWGAVWNDYAEFREVKEKVNPGRCVIETGEGDLILSTTRLQDGAEIVSDTYGFAIGETKKNNTPIASSGRVLAYPLENKEILKKNIGKPVGSGPNGTISLMTDEEARTYPWKIIGTISEIPSYEIWHAGSEEDPNDIEVNGRIWIRIR